MFVRLPQRRYEQHFDKVTPVAPDSVQRSEQRLFSHTITPV